MRCSARSRPFAAEHNKASKAIGRATPEERPAAIEAAKQLADKVKALEPELEETRDRAE